MPTKNEWGGRRNNQTGRPKLGGSGTVRATGTITLEVYEYLKKLGGGNYSKGCRIAAEFHRRMTSTNRDRGQKARRVGKVR